MRRTLIVLVSGDDGDVLRVLASTDEMLRLVGQVLAVRTRHELESDAVGGDESRDEVYDIDVSDCGVRGRGLSSLVAATSVS